MPSFDILAIGNAIVDLLRGCDDKFITSIGALKGHTSYVASSKSIFELCKRLPKGVELAGGAAVNTTVGIASLGGRSTFLGAVADDDYGRIFQHDIRSMGVSFGALAKAASGEETSHALVLITPDGGRTIVTFLGCSGKLHSAFLDAELIGHAKFTYLEGYLFDTPSARSTFQRALSAASAAGRRVALSLSDSNCVERNRKDFLTLIRSGVDIVFGNEKEVLALFDTRSFDDAVRKLGKHVPIAAVTRSERGSIVVSKGATLFVPPDRVRKVVDATGAGDLYAAGFLMGLARQLDLAAAGRLASFCASEIISQIGARPEKRLDHLARMRGFFQ